ncbi:hypothetical protein N7491_007675 [Penicillium cf. griseofulvum]|uniref:Uncharacterized protein n=1 Tax=Penicillium cf. griseofulvum TaxID=2972120 RepID=A0A9W9ITI6_9EURO|nr:hypothetical protein N7472_009300 [Penicillium cf. griseofulvum]KAJ5430659.1 hypothetical protein N7491_007675 [Penicillium cf. griseofulvum]KAJ5435573.1 hypothetical protein N7445_006458 [Penicillium cf. griseofulvum]
MMQQYFSSVSIGPRHSHCDLQSSSQNEADQGRNRQGEADQKSFDIRYYSLDGHGEAPGGHQLSAAPHGRRGNSARDGAHSRQSIRRCNENESSQQAPPPPQRVRKPAIRPLGQTTPSYQLWDDTSIRPRKPTDGGSSQPLTLPSDISWDEYVSDNTVANYRIIGAQYQAWIAGRTTTACPIQRSRVTWEDLVHHPIEDYSFEVYLNEFRSTPEEVGSIESTGLSTGINWRYVFLRRYGHWDGGREEGWTVYQHRTGLGAIFAENITRRFGPYWAQVAQAQYQLDNPIDTLRYVYFTNVQSLYTWPYVEIHLYPRHGLHWFDDPEPQCWSYGTREYQELLGTKLGRGVARLVLGAWPRGTHRIDSIYTWTFVGNLQMRFDIERI